MLSILRLHKWFRGWGKARRSTPRRPGKVRLGVESLGERVLPSVTPLGPAFDVSGSTPGQPVYAHHCVARAANGNFAVTWRDGFDGQGVYARLFNARGAPLTPAMHL